MATHRITCPECRSPLDVAAEVVPGLQLQCPRCRCSFAAPATGAPQPAGGDFTAFPGSVLPPVQAAPEPQPARDPASVQGEDDYRRPWGQKEDRPDDRSPEKGRPWERHEDDWDHEDDWHPDDRPQPLSSDYQIDVGEWFSYAGAHWSAVLGPMIGYFFILVLIQMAAGLFSALGQLASAILGPALNAGFTVVCLAQLQGRSWTFGDFFGGFQRFGALFGSSFLLGLMLLACFLPVGAVAIVLLGNGPPQDAQAVIAILSAVAVGCACLAVYLVLRCSFFCVPLILDRGYGATEAIAGSWALARGHFWGILGVSLLLGLITLGGVLACFVGVLFTFPLATLVQTAGYLLVAGRQPPVRPSRYRDEDRWNED